MQITSFDKVIEVVQNQPKKTIALAIIDFVDDPHVLAPVRHTFGQVTEIVHGEPAADIPGADHADIGEIGRLLEDRV